MKNETKQDSDANKKAYFGNPNQNLTRKSENDLNFLRIALLLNSF